MKKVVIYFSTDRSSEGEWVVARAEDPEFWEAGDFESRLDAAYYAEEVLEAKIVFVEEAKGDTK